MNVSRTRAFALCVALVSWTSVAHAGGLAEPVSEPYVAVPGDATEKVVPVHPAPPKRSRPCRMVTVAVTVDQPQYFGNQGLMAAGCCCGTIAISGHSFVLGGQQSSRQVQDCDGEGNS
jgi:hypothetical protein